MFTKENSASTNFMVTAAGWLIVGVTMGLILALEFVFPDMFRGIPWWSSADCARRMSTPFCLPGYRAG